MCKRCLMAAMLVCWIGQSARGTNRPFTLVEDDYQLGQGLFELENTFTLEHHTREDAGFNNLAAEHELEYGLLENLEVKVAGSYFYEHSSEGAGMHFDEFKIEGALHITNPVTDDVGIGIIASAAVGEHALGFEQFLVVQKDWTKWTVAYHLGFVTEVEGVFDSHLDNQTNGTIVNAVGVDYNFTTDVRGGVEAVAESSYQDWSKYDTTTVYAGPVVNWAVNKSLWITVGADALLTNQRDEPRFMATLIVGWIF